MSVCSRRRVSFCEDHYTLGPTVEVSFRRFFVWSRDEVEPKDRAEKRERVSDQFRIVE